MLSDVVRPSFGAGGCARRTSSVMRLPFWPSSLLLLVIVMTFLLLQHNVIIEALAGKNAISGMAAWLHLTRCLRTLRARLQSS